MSGKGGCGKTEVVSRVCQVALADVYKRRKVGHEAYMGRRLKRECKHAPDAKGGYIC